MSDDPIFGTLAASNLTAGRGGIGATYTDIDYVRAIRHGVGKDNKPLIVMPAQYFNKFSDADLGAIIAYVKSLPPVDNEPPRTSPAPPGRVFAFFAKEILPAREIDHDAPRPAAPEVGVTKEYGEYLSVMCTLCHGEHLSGGVVPGEDSGPKAANLTVLARAKWLEQDFVKTLRTGVTKSGRQLDPEFMPWDRFANLTDDELDALWLYISSLETRRFGK